MLPVEPLSGIATFVVAARSHSFTEAAELLGISKSAVGKSIARLEDRLGVKLFHRTTRKLTLSADGEAYFAACSLALNEIATAETALSSRLHQPSGRLRIDMPVAFGRQVMLPILLEMGKTYPELQFTLTFTDHLIDPIEEGVDLAIRFGEPKDSTDLIARRLTSQRWVICASPDYLTQHGTPRTLDDVQHHHGIVGYRRGQPLSWRVSSEGLTQRLNPPPTHQIGDGDAMVEATLAGLGLCQMPLSLLRRHIQSGRLSTVLEEYTADLIDVYAVWPKVAHLRPKVRHIVDALVELGGLGKLD
ncbi:LysR family transcriptional regulator [Comamonas sp. BIGb0124]|uniref:LysR family transcriptional regulator n=1 Tax=Comamonas sp. BIGb0124 TaxID=2485130 RepID=UPI000F48E1A8|nr:LysR family transcriptional regulator [Comamonas sp. BIGb0124]ROR24736.1 LysR family transcriptional regulator [Comamonas sp. BIGb0124]